MYLVLQLIFVSFNNNNFETKIKERNSRKFGHVKTVRPAMTADENELFGFRSTEWLKIT